MGLDMYLTKRTYVKNWEHLMAEERHQITVLKNGMKTHIRPERISHIIEEIGYWRKANAIHNWIVENVQDGIDQCQLTYLPREKMEKLLGLVNTVLGDHSKAQDLLPTSDGFFFGSTEYDQYYFDDLELTRGIIEKALEEEAQGGDIYYQSSW